MNHPEIHFSNILVRKVDGRKQLGIILDPKLSLSAHIKAVISKARTCIDMLKYSSMFLPRHTLSELLKLYVRPHMENGDFFYHIPTKAHKFSGNIIFSNLMEKLEFVQYLSASD